MKKAIFCLSIVALILAGTTFYFAIRTHDAALANKSLGQDLEAQRLENKEIFDLRAELKVARAARQEAADQKLDTEHENEELRNRQSAHEAEVKRLSRALDDERHAREAAEAKAEEAQRGEKEQGSKLSELEKKLAEERALSESLNGELAMMRSDPQYKIGREEAEKIRVHSAQVEQELATAKESVADLSRRLEEAQAQLIAIQSDPSRREMEEELKATKARVSEVESQNIWLRRELHRRQ